MRVIWLCNVPFPDACKQTGITVPVVGGWMYSGALALLAENKTVQLTVVSPYAGNEFVHFKKKGIEYYMFPTAIRNNLKELERYFAIIYKEVQPDLSHVHGTEYLHSLAFTNVANLNKLVVSIQGLVSVYANYFLGGISKQEIRKTITVRDIIRRDTLLDQQKNMVKRGNHEIELLEKVKHVIGRTSWDYANVWAINTNFTYHFCNESLRAGFYDKKWSYENCEKKSIFLSQAHYPIKGLQQVIKAIPLVIKKYPNTKIYIAGNDITKGSSLKKNGFSNYIEKLMNQYGVQEYFCFLGNLSEEEMVNEYLKANVFVCPSSIENSPNSVGEAQLLGTPVIASYTGGTMDMIKNHQTGFLYRFEETTLLAKQICDVFSSPELCQQLSDKAIEIAAHRHNRVSNARTLDEIYKRIV